MGNREYLAGHYDQPTLDMLDEGPELGTYQDYFLTFADFQHPLLHGPFKGRELGKAIARWREEAMDDRIVPLFMTEAMVLHWPPTHRRRPT